MFDRGFRRLRENCWSILMISCKTASELLTNILGYGQVDWIGWNVSVFAVLLDESWCWLQQTQYLGCIVLTSEGDVVSYPDIKCSFVCACDIFRHGIHLDC